MECTENNKKNQNNNEITVISFALPQKKTLLSFIQKGIKLKRKELKKLEAQKTICFTESANFEKFWIRER